MSMTEVIVIRVSKKLKEDMKKTPINWPKFLRRAIKKKIRREIMKRAAMKLDEIRKKSKKLPPGTVEAWIREYRETR